VIFKKQGIFLKKLIFFSLSFIFFYNRENKDMSPDYHRDKFVFFKESGEKKKKKKKKVPNKKIKKKKKKLKSFFKKI